MTAFGTRSSQALFSDAHRGCRKAREVFVRENALLVYKIVNRYPAASYMKDDLIQEGMLGLIKALDKFDIDRGYKFSTYAVPWIRVHIERFIQANFCIVSMPTRTQILALKISALRSKLTNDEIVKKLGISHEAFAALDHVVNDIDDTPIVSSFKTESQALNEIELERAIGRLNVSDNIEREAVLIALGESKKYSTFDEFSLKEGIKKTNIRALVKEKLALLTAYA